MTLLYHYTCEHGHTGLGTQGMLRPHGVRGLIAPMVWLTDLDEPIAAALGLTQHRTICDRTGYRYRVTDNEGTLRWISVRRQHPLRHALEGEPGVRPMHWWVSLVPVPVVYDPIGVTV